MLRNVPNVISPELMYILMSMGHGDELVIADANFPAMRMAQGTTWGHYIEINCGIPELMEAILRFMPLDYAVDAPFMGMQVTAGQPAQPIHDRYGEVMQAAGYGPERMEFLPKPEFYDRASRSFAIVKTGERARFANVVLRCGVIKEDE